MEAVIIPEGDQEARQYEKDTHPNMKLPKKALKYMGKPAIKNICKVGDEYQVGGHGAYTG